jgi:hypothetical protein
MPSSFGLRPRIITMEPVTNSLPHLPRLGVNRAGYRGERINAARILKEIRFLANRHRFNEHVSAVGDHELVFLSRLGRSGPRIYLSAGIHGDEPAGLVALLDLIRDERGYRTVVLERPEPHPASCLQTVFENGALRRRCSLEEVRARAMQG